MNFTNSVTYNFTNQEIMNSTESTTSGSTLKLPFQFSSHSISSYLYKGINAEKSSIIHRVKETKLVDNLFDFFHSEIFRSIFTSGLIDQEQKTVFFRDSEGSFYFGWHHPYADGCIRNSLTIGEFEIIHMLIEFYRCISCRKIIDFTLIPLIESMQYHEMCGEKRVEAAKIITLMRKSIIEYSIMSRSLTISDPIIREVFFVFKTFEYIWLTSNFHGTPEKTRTDSLQPSLLIREKCTQLKEFKAVIVGWNIAYTKFEIIECIAKFEGSFLLNITKSTTDFVLIDNLSKIPSDHLILPTLSFFNSQEKSDKPLLLKKSADFGFDRESLRKIITFLQGKENFVQAIHSYLLNGPEDPITDSNLISSKSIQNQDFLSTFNSAFQMIPEAWKPKNLEVSGQAFQEKAFTKKHRTESINELTITEPVTLTEPAVSTELSPEKYLEFINFLKKEIWGNKQPVQFLLNALTEGLTKRNGECSFKTKDFETIQQSFDKFFCGDDKNKAIINDCLEFLQIKKIKRGPSSKNREIIPLDLAKRIARALFIHKFQEISLHANYPHARRDKKNKLPVFFVIPQEEGVTIYCLQGHFEGFVIRKIQNDSSSSYTFLKQLVGDAHIEKQEKDGCTTAFISLAAFEKLEAVAKKSLILKLTDKKFYKQNTQKKEQGGDCLKTTKDDKIKEFAEIGKKRKIFLAEDREPPKKMHKPTERAETATEHLIKNETEFQTRIIINETAQKNLSEKEGMFQPSGSRLEQQNDFLELSPDNFLEKISSVNLEQIIQPIQKKHQIQSVLVKEEKIHFPMNEKIEGLDPSKMIALFNPLLKEYQKKAVAEMLRFSDKELSAFLAAEMGLGKTFIMFEWASQLIASGKKGIHLFLMPVSLLAQTEKEVRRAWLEITRTAWQTRKSLESKEVMQKAVLEALTACEIGSPEMLYLLYAIVPFLHEWFHDRSIKEYFQKNRIASDIVKVVNLHLENIRKIPNWEKTFQYELQQKEAQATIDQEVPHTYQVQDMIWSVQQDDFPSETFLLKAATILNIHPGRQAVTDLGQTVEGAKRITDLYKNRPITFFKADVLNEYLKKTESQDSGFIITSFECLENKNSSIKSLLGSKNIASIIVDEADRLHNIDSMDTKCVKGLLENSKQNGTLLQLISGTPFQNSFTEIYTLVSVANPAGSFPAIAQKTLALSTGRCIKRITQEKKIDEQKLNQTVLKTFVDFNTFADVIRKMIIRVGIKDEQVMKDWNNQIPSFEIKSIFVDLKKEIKDKIERAKNAQNNFLTSFHQIKQILIHPSLKSLKRNSPEFNHIINVLKSADLDVLKQHIDDSALLKGLLDSEPILDCLSKKDRTIIFVQNLIEADVIKTIIHHVYKNHNPFVAIYEGSLNSEERNRIVEHFKNQQDGNQPYFLILMTECGGVGLNLQEAARCIIASQSFNPSKDDQARARCIRVNSVGHKIIYEIQHNDSSSVHLRLIRQEKRDWANFLFTSQTETIENSFQKWKKLLKTMCEIKFINSNVSKDSPRYQLFLERMNGILFDPDQYAQLAGKTLPNTTFMQDSEAGPDIIPMEDFSEVTEALSREPILKEVIPIFTPEQPSLQFKDWWVLPIPVQWSSRKIIKTAAYIRLERPVVIPKLLQDINSNNLVDIIRTGSVKDDRVKNVLAAYERIADEALNADLDLEGVNIQTYRVENGRFILSTETSKDASQTIRLYEKERTIEGVSQLHLDILLRK